VFLKPPWLEIYSTDPERRHSLEKARAEYRLLLEDYPSLGYEVCIVPRIEVSERADFVLNALAEYDVTVGLWVATLRLPAAQPMALSAQKRHPTGSSARSASSPRPDDGARLRDTLIDRFCLTQSVEYSR
jgi:hypothetical protein